MNKEPNWNENLELQTSITPNRALHEVRLRQTRAIVEYARTGKTDHAPDMMHEDVSFYTDPVWFEREYRRLFRETPLVACFSKDLPAPGSYRLFEDAGIPIIIWRGKDNVVRGFLNVCPHRGAKVAREACGKSARVTCRFHGWTFDSAGKAVGVPEEKEFCGKIDAQKHLVPVPVEERHGVVFVLATPGGKMDLDAHLGAFAPELEALGLGDAHCVVEEDVANPSNWKYTMETYMENYHLPALHKVSFAQKFANNLHIYQTWGPHHRFTWPFANIEEWMDKPESEWPVDNLPMTYFIFPNMHMSVGSVTPKVSLNLVHRLFPTSMGTMVSKSSLYAPGGVQSREQLADIRAGYIKTMDVVKLEDYSVTGESWAAFAAMPPGQKFAIGRHELGVQHFHNSIRKRVEG
jgi:phenylpropionate dioxygenase-like ring-hydroxylating dioxygenase large terminal subunit